MKKSDQEHYLLAGLMAVILLSLVTITHLSAEIMSTDNSAAVVAANVTSTRTGPASDGTRWFLVWQTNDPKQYQAELASLKVLIPKYDGVITHEFSKIMFGVSIAGVSKTSAQALATNVGAVLSPDQVVTPDMLKGLPMLGTDLPYLSSVLAKVELIAPTYKPDSPTNVNALPVGLTPSLIPAVSTDANNPNNSNSSRVNAY